MSVRARRLVVVLGVLAPMVAFAQGAGGAAAGSATAGSASGSRNTRMAHG
jgi:hypothetical protein